MNTAPASFFSSNVNGMDATSKLPFFPADFIGECTVDACKGLTTRKGKRAYIVELTVNTTNRPDVYVGGRYSWYQDLTEEGTAYPACIAFLYACLGLDPSKPADKATIEAKVKPNQDKWLNGSINEDPKAGEVQPLKGSRLHLQTSEKKKKDFKNMELVEARAKGGIYTVHVFSPAKSPAAADAA